MNTYPFAFRIDSVSLFSSLKPITGGWDTGLSQGVYILEDGWAERYPSYRLAGYDPSLARIARARDHHQTVAGNRL